MVDFDRLVNAASMRTFARPVEYRRPNGPPATLRGVFHREHIALAMADGAAVSAMQARLSVRLSEFPPHLSPRQGDVVTIGAETWQVMDVQPDAEGVAALLLSAYQPDPLA